VSARQKAVDTLGWFALVCGAVLGVLTVYSVATHPPTELSVIELLSDGIIAVTWWRSARGFGRGGVRYAT